MAETWTGRISSLGGPKYMRIVRAIGDAVRAARSRPEISFLPSGTWRTSLASRSARVARAYQVGRRTRAGWTATWGGGPSSWVRAPARWVSTGTVDLTMNRPVDRPIRDRVLRVLRNRAKEQEAADLLLCYRGESARDAAAAARWLSRAG